MAWFKLNDTLNTLKGQISSVSNVVQEVFTEGITAESSSSEPETNDLHIKDAGKEIATLTGLCSSQESEIISLRRQIENFEQQTKITDTGGTSATTKTVLEHGSEDSWFWDTEQTTTSSSSSKENEIVMSSKSGSPGDLTLIPLDNQGCVSELPDKLYRIIDKRDDCIKQFQSENSDLKDQIKVLTLKNREMNENIEELDRQHGITIEKLLALKHEIQDRCDLAEKNGDDMKKEKNDITDNFNQFKEKYFENDKLYKNEIQMNVNLKAQIEELNSKFENKSKENDKLLGMLDEKDKELSDRFEYIEIDKDKINQHELQVKIVELQNNLSEFQSVKDMVNNLQLKIDHTEGDNLKLQSQMAEYQEKCQMLELKLNELNDIKLEKEQIEIEYSTLQEDDLILQKEFYELKKNDSILRDDCTVFQQKYNLLNDKYNELQKNFDQLTSEQIQKSTLEEEFINLKESASENESRLIQENVILHKQVIDLQSSLNSEISQKSSRSEQNAVLTYEQVKDLLKKNVQNIDSLITDHSFEALINFIGEKLGKMDIVQMELDDMKQKFAHTQNQPVDEEFQTKAATLIKQQNRLKNENDTIRADLHHYEIEVAELMKNNEILLTELEVVKSAKLETISEQNEDNIVILEKELEDCSKLNKNLEDEYVVLRQKLTETEVEIQEKTKENIELTKKLQLHTTKLDELSEQLKSIETEKSDLQFEIDELKLDNSKQLLQEQIEKHQSITVSLHHQLEMLNQDHADLVGKLQSLQKNSIEKDSQYQIEIQTEKENADKKLMLLEKKDNDVKELLQEVHDLKLQLKEMHKISTEKLENENKLMELEAKLKMFENDIKNKESQMIALQHNAEKENKHLTEQINSLTINIDHLQSELKNQSTNDHLIEINATLQNSIEQLTKEKSELFNLVTDKYQENVKYHEEIQRLDNLLKCEIEKSNNCQNCINLQQQIEIKNSNLTNMEKLQDQVVFLQEKSDILTQNLLTEQNMQRQCNQKKLELLDEKNNLSKELERLREHLMETAESHTQETLQLQQIIDENNIKIAAIEEDARQSSNAFTSASIRANQQSEILQAQCVVLSQQREELLIKLSGAEDRESKNEAALINLQCALEQFQKNKERDIENETHRIEKELETERKKQIQLQNEIDNLNKQLTESKTGLLAAGRITDQLELSQLANTQLRDELQICQKQINETGKKLQELENGHADKVEKGLLKNLIIGYIVTSNHMDKMQILKLISSVLDFNKNETDKVGLNKTHAGWLSSIVQITSGNSGNTTDSYNKDSLAQAFVKFLEKESQPRKNSTGAANLLNIVHHSVQQQPNSLNIDRPLYTEHIGELTGNSGDGSSSSSSNSSISRGSSIYNSNINVTPIVSTTIANSNNPNNQPPIAVIQPILLSDTVLQNFAPPRNSSSILKDILNDS